MEFVGIHNETAELVVLRLQIEWGPTPDSQRANWVLEASDKLISYYKNADKCLSIKEFTTDFIDMGNL